jgi:hypothetical protein
VKAPLRTLAELVRAPAALSVPGDVVAGAAAVWAYDLRAKNTAAGPAGMATCRALDVLLGATAGDPVRALPAALAVAAHTYTVTELSRREVSGSDSTALPAATLAATAGLAGAVASRGTAATAMLAGEYLTSYGRAQARLLTDPGAGNVRAAVGAGITALPALQGALTARAGRTWTGLAVAAAAPLGRLLARKISPT